MRLSRWRSEPSRLCPLSKTCPALPITKISRTGKPLFLEFLASRLILINPMLTVGLMYCPSANRVAAVSNVIFTFDATALAVMWRVQG